MRWHLTAFLLLSSSLVSAQPNQQPVELKQVTPRLYEVVGGRGATGAAYIGDDGVLMVDAKMDQQSVEQVIAKVKALTGQPIRFLVNSHSDGDHVSGNRFFPEGIVIVAHENCRKEFFHPRRDGNTSEWNDPALAKFVPSVTFRQQLEIHLGSQTVQLWYFGVGHTTGDSVIYFPQEKVAFLGDQLFLTRTQLIHSYKGGNSFEHVKTLSKMLSTLDAEKFLSGHSEPADRQAVQKHISEMQTRQQKVEQLQKQGKTLDEIRSAFPEEDARLIESIFEEIRTGKNG